jgi:hypothetical protein
MMNVCYGCGVYRVDKIIDPAGPFAVCPECGFKHPFKQLPLFLVGGAAGSGKTTVLRQLIGAIDEVAPLDSDMLWRAEFDHPETNYRDCFETWLRVCKNISQLGKPALLFGGGFCVPHNIEPCVERRYFSTLHYLALTCDDEVLVSRIRARPSWRNSSKPEFIQRHLEFNRWLRREHANTSPPVELLDTTTNTPELAAARIKEWVRSKLGQRLAVSG